ncbi:MAG: dnaE2 [Mucilaginibacter sp.]|nr:dnaE2 [Mucilaginibacter sp.]
MSTYIELQCASHFSFLRGVSSAEDLFATAAILGMKALAITDLNSLSGIVRAHEAARTTGVRLIVGCRLRLRDGSELLVYPRDRPAYARLCRLLSVGKGRAGKAKCDLTWEDVGNWAEGLIAILVPDRPNAALRTRLKRLKTIWPEDGYCALTLRRRPGDALRLHQVAQMAAEFGVLPVATNDVLFHEPGRRVLQNVVTCIREGCTIDTAGFKLERHADRYLKAPAEIARLFRIWPDAVARSVAIAEQLRFSLNELAYQYPHEVCIPGLTPQAALEKLTWEGTGLRYPEGLPESVEKTLRHELTLIESLGYAPYFLTVHSIVRFARSQGILCQGRGSAANSAVCYVLGITSIDPERNDLLFERFVSQERKEPPDIDVDFEHERREEVIQWVYNTYGRHRSALCSTVIRYRARGALRDVAKAMGLPEDMIKMLSSQVWGWSEEGVEPKHAQELNLNLSDHRLKLTLELARQLIGAPRHLSQHPGGFVLTEERLDDLVPIEPAAMEDRQVIEWDKDDIDALKFMKVDVLALGMLTCMQKGFNLLREHKGIDLDLATIPSEDPRTYAMIRKADTLGTFQIESRAQMAMLPRLKPRTFYDLVIEVAIVRPGPIQGDMVHPYLRRREGKEEVVYPKPELEKVLGKTLGVPLFQEQAMRVAIECAGFTPGEADQLRRAMATFKFTGGVSAFGEKLVTGMMERGYDEEFARKTFSQLEGFGSYGFPESHAASFALIAYASSWLKCWHPDAFCVGLLNAQPMGFYAPAQIVRDAIDHGVEVRPVDINASRWDCTLEPTDRDGRFAVRLGFRLVAGLKNDDGAKLAAARAEVPFSDVEDTWRRCAVQVSSLVRLAEADAFRPSMGVARREALWAIKALRDNPLPLFASRQDEQPVPEVNEVAVRLKAMTAGHEVIEDYAHIGLTLRAHPVSFLRPELAAKKIVTCADATVTADRRKVTVAGLVLVRQRPGSAKGVMFITIEDETGTANLVIWPSLYEKQRQVVHGAHMLAVEGRVQREGLVVHIVADKLIDLSDHLAGIGETEEQFQLPHGRGDEFHHGGGGTDSRTRPPRKVRDIFVPDLHIDTLKLKPRNFR